MRPILAVLMIALSATAASAVPEARLHVIARAGADPYIEAALVGVRVPGASPISIHATASDAPTISATRVTPYAQGPEPLALVIVMNGQEIWIGDEEEGGDDSTPGALNPLRHVLDRLALATRVPPASDVCVVSYAAGADVLAPMSPVATFKSTALGTEHDYRGKIGSDMVAGVERGLRELRHSPALQKALIVVGDGNDTNNETAKPRLAELRDQAIAMHVEMFSVIWRSPVSSEEIVLDTMIPDHHVVHDAATLETAFDAITAKLGNRSYVTFASDRLPWDGQSHALVVRVGDTDLAPATVDLPDRRTPQGWWRSWWKQLAIGVGVIAAIALALKLRS